MNSFSYLLLIQPAGKQARVEYVDADTNFHTPIFEGGRWAARRFLKCKAQEIGWEAVPQFCQKKGRNGFDGSRIQIYP